MTPTKPPLILAARVGRHRRLSIGLVGLVAAGLVVHAHDLGRSESSVTARGSEVRARLTLDLLELDGIDSNADGRVSYGELDQGIDRLYAIVKAHLSINAGAPPLRTTLERYAVKDEHVGQLDLLLTFDHKVSRLTITSTLDRVLRPTHEHLTSVSFEETVAPRRAVLGAGMPEADFAQGANSYPATIVLGLLAAGAIGCGAAVPWLRRAFRR